MSLAVELGMNPQLSSPRGQDRRVVVMRRHGVRMPDGEWGEDWGLLPWRRGLARAGPGMRCACAVPRAWKAGFSSVWWRSFLMKWMRPFRWGCQGGWIAQKLGFFLIPNSDSLTCCGSALMFQNISMQLYRHVGIDFFHVLTIISIKMRLESHSTADVDTGTINGICDGSWRDWMMDLKSIGLSLRILLSMVGSQIWAPFFPLSFSIAGKSLNTRNGCYWFQSWLSPNEHGLVILSLRACLLTYKMQFAMPSPWAAVQRTWYNADEAFSIVFGP